jgi:threonine dehydrogenase-like Zn-dependent dehydrogenase
MIEYRAAVLKAPRNLAMESRTVRRLKPSEALIRVIYAGVCGTDLAIYRGDYPVPLPLVLGHEFSGIVARVGSSRFSRLIGKRATAEINNTCLSRGLSRPCSACRRGLDHHCLRRTVTGIVRHDGAFAEYIIVPVRNIHIIPRPISLEEAVFVEPLAAALQTFRLTPVAARQRVVILGAGRLGLLIGIVAQSKRAHVLVITRSPQKQKTAQRFGLTCIAQRDARKVVRLARTWTGRLGADIVIEATGSPGMVPVALEIVRSRGTIALKSTPGTPLRTLDTTRIVVDEIQLQGSRCGNFRDALSFLSASKVGLSALVEGVFPLKDVNTAISRAETRAKILIHCSAE